MTHRIDLPNGGWADIRDSPDECSNRQLRPVSRARTLLFMRADWRELSELRAIEDEKEREQAATALEARLGPERFADLNDLMADLSNAQAAAMVEQWSYAGEPTADAVDDLPMRTRIALIAAVDRVMNDQPVDGKAAMLDPTREPDGSND